MTSNSPAAHSPRPAMGASRDGRIVRLVLFAMLMLNAAAAFLFGDRIWQSWREGNIPDWVPLLLPGTFTAFVAVFTVDRWLMVRRHRYPLSRALFQVGFALVFLTLLLPQQASELKQLKATETGSRGPALELLSHSDASVRAAACGLLLGRYPPEVYVKVQELAHADTAPEVRTQCTQALARLHQAAQGSETR